MNIINNYFEFKELVIKNKIISYLNRVNINSEEEI